MVQRINHTSKSQTERAYAALRRELKSRGINVPLTAKQLTEQRIEREKRQRTYSILPLRRRLESTLLCRYLPKIRERGGETEIEESSGSMQLEVRSRANGLTLLGCEGWRQYSRRFGARKAALRYLCGVDDNGVWAVRVAGTCDSVWEAIDWVEPAAVRKARTDGRAVLRQGDVYIIEMSRDRATASTSELPESHHWDPHTRTLTHESEEGDSHAPLHVPFPCKFVRQRVYHPGRSGRRTYGD